MILAVASLHRFCSNLEKLCSPFALVYYFRRHDDYTHEKSYFLWRLMIRRYLLSFLLSPLSCWVALVNRQWILSERVIEMVQNLRMKKLPQRKGAWTIWIGTIFRQTLNCSSDVTSRGNRQKCYIIKYSEWSVKNEPLVGTINLSLVGHDGVATKMTKNLRYGRDSGQTTRTRSHFTYCNYIYFSSSLKSWEMEISLLCD